MIVTLRMITYDNNFAKELTRQLPLGPHDLPNLFFAVESQLVHHRPGLKVTAALLEDKTF